MKKWLSICAFLLCQLALFAQAGASESDFNPNTPPNPDMPRPKFTLTLNTSPVQGGYLDNGESSVIMAGTKIWIGAYPNSNFVFERWTENGETVSTSNGFYYEMPERNASLTAVFRYDPTTPPNPEAPKLKHMLYLESQPVQAGWFSWNSVSVIREDEPMDVYAYNNNGFRFKEWQIDGQTVSTDYRYSFTMPQSDLHLMAIYEYAPSLPKNPGSNYFDPVTGEVIVNDFEPGDLYNAMWTVTEGDQESVSMITVVGPITNGDWSVARSYPNCKSIDLSRTNGMTGVPGWAFDNCQNLESIILPASISSINGYAFSGCSSLQSLTVLSTTPPTVSRSAFEGCVTENITVFVPAASAPLYRSAEVWKDFNIQLLSSQVKSLKVNLPENTNTDLYKGMYIDLSNVTSGQKQRFVITDRLTYTFGNLMHNTTYNVYLRNSKDEELGSIGSVQIIDKDVVVTFESLLVPRTVKLKVLTPAHEDVTSQVTITWMDKAGNYLLRGNQIAAQLDSTELKYRVILPQTLAMQYQLPETVDYIVLEDSIVYELKAIPSMTISGKVEDNKEHQAIANAVVSVSQTFNGQYTKSYTTKTNAEGLWQLQVLQANTEISASKTGYVSQTQQFDSLVAEIPTFTLKDISGTTITLNLSYTDVNGKATEGYKDSINVAYSVYNVTGDSAISNFSLQYPKIVLMETHEGAKLRITATSKVKKFMPVEAITTVDANDQASVSLSIKQLGGIKASYIQSDNTSIVGILYDANGKLVTKYDYANANLQIGELADDTYTLVTMGGSQFFNNIFSLDQFSNSGLRAGIDYVKNAVKVESGQWATVSNQIIPYLDETKLYYTSSKTSFSANKSEITAGQFLTLSAFIDFKSSYADVVSDVKLIVNMPASTKFVESSVLRGSVAADYTYDEAEHSVIIPVPENFNDQIRFCVIPTAGGTYSPAAAVQFKFDGKTFTQPIGSVTFKVTDLSITVPSVVSKTNIPVSGSAVGKSNVKVYADDVLLAQTTSLSNGVWATNIDLMIEDPDTLSTHTVYAVITTQDGIEMSSESQVVTYDPQAIQVTNVIMYYTNPEENWWRGKNYELVHNFLSPSVSPFRYTYYIYNRLFTFAINFSNNDSTMITNVILEVKTGNGRWNALEAKYDEHKKCWLVYGEFGNMYDGIVPVNVRVKYTFRGEEYVVAYPGPDADVPIDPSGYVYEAVSSNRLQGVTATIFYKEEVTDMYGDIHERIVQWDAEEYAQENPLFTDENGMYRWDVPQGLWQVKFEKEGYQTAYTEWLPVPPPQLDVNIGLIQLSQPNMKKPVVFNKGIDIEFDKYMDPATLTTDNIMLTYDDQVVAGTIELLNEEAVDEKNAQTYASKLRFNLPDSVVLLNTDKIELTVSSNVKSYAGIPVAGGSAQEFDVESKVKNFDVDSLVNIEYGQIRSLTVAALPVDASKGKTLRVKALSETIAKVSSTELVLDENGQAEFSVEGDMPGATVITFEIEGVDLMAHTKVNVKEAALLKTLAPRASRVTGSEVYRGTKVLLSSDTENAEILYTLDGSDPIESGIPYNDTPIVIADDSITIKAVAKGHDLDPSDVVTFDYTLKKTAIGYNLPEGWSWISHNLENAVAPSVLNADIERLMSQTKEVIKDPVVGLIGNLTELQPGEAYKVQVKNNASARLQGFECNASATSVPVVKGWNWLGYPVNQTMFLSEALAFYEANEGDYIVGQDGYAEFTDGEWKGDLKGLTPGKGYMFKANSDNEIVFNNTVVSVAASRIGQRNMLMNSPWAPAKYGYPNVMPLTAELFANGEKINAADYVVGAFVDSECRGVGQWMEGRLLMTVYGDGGEAIRFVAKDLTNDTYYDITEQVVFASDNVGSWHAPYALTIGTESTGVDVEEISSEFTVTPTVVHDHVTVSAAGYDISSLTLTNMGGRVVLALSDLGKGATITTSQLPAGMYIVTVKTNGQTYYKKIIKG